MGQREGNPVRRINPEEGEVYAMTCKMRSVLVAAFVLALMSERASATFHLMRIVEIFPGTTRAATAQYVMLQMYFPGQNLVGGHSLTVFDANGVILGTFTFAGNVSNGADDATILIATPDADTLFGVPSDLTMSPVIQPAGGAVCWDVFNCVAWGSFNAPSSLPSFATVTTVTDALSLGMALHRDLVGSTGATTDFILAPPAPKNNAGQVGALSCGGDCNGDGQVTVDEVLTLIDIALGSVAITQCEPGDSNRDGHITIDEILTAVENALNGC
jgi:hypothetical protein